MLKTQTIIHWVKLLQPFSQLTEKRQVSVYYHGFITIIWSHCSKTAPAGFLYAKKMCEGVLLNVLWIGFSLSPLSGVQSNQDDSYRTETFMLWYLNCSPKLFSRFAWKSALQRSRSFPQSTILLSSSTLATCTASLNSTILLFTSSVLDRQYSFTVEQLSAISP